MGADSEGSRSAASPAAVEVFLGSFCRPDEAPAIERFEDSPGGNSGRRSKLQMAWVGVICFFVCDATSIISMSARKELVHDTFGFTVFFLCAPVECAQRPGHNIHWAAMPLPCR